MKKLTFINPDVAIKLTEEQAKQLGIDITLDQQHLNVEHFGPWQIVKSCKGLTQSSKFESGRAIETTLYGQRTLSQVTQGGYELNGYVSIQGKKYSAFTSSQLFNVNGHLIDVGIIHARVR
jgi:hypothetical protein